MKAIKECHTNNPYLKFLGVCNDQKTALNMCLRKEVRSSYSCSFSRSFASRRESSPLTFSSAADGQQRQGRAVGNHEKAKAKRKEVEEKWKLIEAET